MDILDSLPNVKLFFNHKLTGADFKANKAWFEARDKDFVANGRPREIEITFDLMIGADGAHSAVRYHLMKFTRMDYQQEYIDTLWCEFHLPPRAVDEDEKDPNAKFRISPNHLHIWPGKDFMFIAIPSEVGFSRLQIRIVISNDMFTDMYSRMALSLAPYSYPAPRFLSWRETPHPCQTSLTNISPALLP